MRSKLLQRIAAQGLAPAPPAEDHHAGQEEFAQQANGFNHDFQASQEQVQVRATGPGTKVRSGWDGPQAVSATTLHQDDQMIGTVATTIHNPEGIKTMRMESLERVSDAPGAQGVVTQYLHDYVVAAVARLGITHVVVAGNRAPGYWKHFASKHPDLQWDFGA